MEAINISNFSLQLYELIRSRTDEDTAKKAVQAVEGMVEQKTEQKLSGIATKQDIYLLKEDIGRIKEDMGRIKEDIVRVETKVATKDDIIGLQRWLLGTVIVMVVMILGLYFKKA